MDGDTPDLSGGAGGGPGSGAGAGAGGSGAGGPGLGAGAGGAGSAGGIGAGGAAAGSQLLPILIVGGLSGIVAMGGLIALNVVPVHSGGSGASPRGLVLVACPDTGPVLAVIDPGQKLLVTGRSADGSWLQVYLPGPALPYAWAPAGELQPNGDTSTLPVAACDIAAASPSGTPIVATASPSQSAPPSPSPSAPPVANTGPTLTKLASTGGTIFLPKANCTQTPRSLSISVSATDPEGVGAVDLFWRLPGQSYTKRSMSHGAGNTWAIQLFAETDIKTTGTVSYFIQATDASPAKLTRRTPTADTTFTVKKCDIPPVVDGFKIYTPGQSGGVIFVKRGGTSSAEGECATHPSSSNYIQLTGSGTDADDAIVKMVFRYRPYGTTTYKVLTLVSTSAGGFTGKLYAKEFKQLPDKPSGVYAFDGYFLATDKSGRSSVRYPELPFTMDLTEKSCWP